MYGQYDPNIVSAQVQHHAYPPQYGNEPYGYHHAPRPLKPVPLMKLVKWVVFLAALSGFAMAVFSVVKLKEEQKKIVALSDFVGSNPSLSAVIVESVQLDELFIAEQEAANLQSDVALYFVVLLDARTVTTIPSALTGDMTKHLIAINGTEWFDFGIYAGTPGAPGLNCWDLNGDTLCNLSEDVNGDGVCDASDCAGTAETIEQYQSIVDVVGSSTAIQDVVTKASTNYAGGVYVVNKKTNVTGIAIHIGATTITNASTIIVKLLQAPGGVTAPVSGAKTIPVIATVNASVTTASTVMYLNFTSPVLVQSGLLHVVWAGTYNSTFSVKTHTISARATYTTLVGNLTPISYALATNASTALTSIDLTASPFTADAASALLVNLLGPRFFS